MPGSTGELAATLERLGFDAVTLADSPLLAGEIHGQLMIAAGATKRLEIVSGLTNSVTRDASVTASAFAASRAAKAAYRRRPIKSQEL